jgi:hypothetical protein
MRRGVDLAWTQAKSAVPRAALFGLLSNGEGGNRTHDTTIFSRVLYQLSYLAWEMRGQGRAPTGRLATGGARG